MRRLRIIFAGSGEFGLPTLGALIQRHDVALVVSRDDRPAGRARKLTPTPIARFAAERGLPLLKTTNINQESLPAADVMVVIAFGEKIAPVVASAPPLGSVNLHASLLPKYRGASPIHRAVLDGETVTGNSIIRLAEKMDAGAVLGQSHRTIEPMQTTGELHDLLAADGVELMLGVLEALATGNQTETPQDETKATLARKLSREDSIMDFTQPADRVARQVRGLWPWPACHVGLHDAAGAVLRKVSLVRARLAAGEGDRWLPGEIMTSGFISVGNGEEGVEIVELQPEGGRVMSVADYSRGNPWHPGVRLASQSK